MFYWIQSMASNFSTLPKTHNRLAKYRNVQYQSSRLASQINIISVGNDFAQWKTDQFAARETRAPLLRLCGIYRSIQLHSQQKWAKTIWRKLHLLETKVYLEISKIPIFVNRDFNLSPLLIVAIPASKRSLEHHFHSISLVQTFPEELLSFTALKRRHSLIQSSSIYFNIQIWNRQHIQIIPHL